jgi:hypothetical protein
VNKLDLRMLPHYLRRLSPMIPNNCSNAPVGQCKEFWERPVDMTSDKRDIMKVCEFCFKTVPNYKGFSIV